MQLRLILQHTLHTLDSRSSFFVLVMVLFRIARGFEYPRCPFGAYSWDEARFGQ